MSTLLLSFHYDILFLPLSIGRARSLSDRPWHKEPQCGVYDPKLWRTECSTDGVRDWTESTEDWGGRVETEGEEKL